MGNEFKGIALHSAEYFGDTRDHWWHHDYLEMVSRRWRIEQINSVLDVGCGVGHWGRVLARVLPGTTRLVGIDREERWIEHAAQRASAAGLSDRFTYRVASAEALPFDDSVFDMVTCQTLLMHVRDPQHVLAEMVRVTRPGGLVVVAEATNIVGPLVDSIALGDSPDMTATLIQFHLVCQQGMRSLGQGHHLLGESLPLLFRRAALEQIEIRQNDNGWSLLPPYASPFERAQIEEEQDAAERGLAPWDEATTRRYFLGGGGTEIEFAKGWNAALAQQRRISEAIRAETFSRAGGGFFYLVWGRRPPPETGG